MAERAITDPAGTIPQWTIGDRLTKARESAGIGVQEMADRLGRSRNSITRYESAVVLDDVHTMVIRLYALETGVSQAWIEDGDGPGSLRGHPDTDPSGGVPPVLERRRRGRQQGGTDGGVVTVRKSSPDSYDRLAA